MKTLLSVFVVPALLCLSLKSHGQYFYNCSIQPLNATSNDSIFIRDSIALPYAGMQLYYDRIAISDSFIVINQCYNNIGGTTITRSTSQMTSIGKLSVGHYNGVIYSHSQHHPSDTACSEYPADDTIHFSFTVTAPSGINDQGGKQFILSPNPATDKLYLNTSLQDIDLTISDMTGRVYVVPYSQREIDVSSLSSGVYCLRLQDRSGTIVRRFVKE